MDHWDQYFDHLLTAHHHRVRDAVAHLGVPWDLVDDYAQEAFILLYRKGPSLPTAEEQALLAWTIATARNVARNAWRKHHRRSSVHALLENDGVAAEAPENVDQRLQALQHCLERVPQEQRESLKRFYAGESIHVLAPACGRTVTSFRRWLSRIRGSLRLCIESKLRWAP